MELTKKLDAPINPKNWKRRAVRTCDVEITLESDSILRGYYQVVEGRLEEPRHYMRAGFQDDRLEWLRVVADALGKGLPIPKNDFEELIDILKGVADGVLPAKAFGLDSDKRKQRTIDLKGLREIAETVYIYSKQGYPLSASKNKDSAFVMAAKSLGFKTETRTRKEARRAQQGWEIFGGSITTFWETGTWREPFPPIEKLTPKQRKK